MSELSKTTSTDSESVNSEMSKREFTAMLLGYTPKVRVKPRVVSPYIQRLTDALIQGRHIDLKRRDQSEVLHELCHRRAKILLIRDYEAIDRVIAHIKKNRLIEARNALYETKERWIHRKSEFKEKCKQRITKAEESYEQKSMSLDLKFADVSMERKFSKRSPTLLQEQAKEKYMILGGFLEKAEETRQYEQFLAQNEAEYKHSLFLKSYQVAKDNLRREHHRNIQKIKEIQEFQYRCLELKEAEELEVLQKRYRVVSRNCDGHK